MNSKRRIINDLVSTQAGSTELVDRLCEVGDVLAIPAGAEITRKSRRASYCALLCKGTVDPPAGAQLLRLDHLGMQAKWQVHPLTIRAATPAAVVVLDRRYAESISVLATDQSATPGLVRAAAFGGLLRPSRLASQA